MPPHKRPVLVEYLLRLVWDHEEYELLVRGRREAFVSFERAGLTREQGEAVVAAVKGDQAALNAAVAAECEEFSGLGIVLWNATNFIFGTHPPPTGGGTQPSGE